MTITLLAPDGVPITAQQFRQAQAATHGGGSGRRLGGRSGFRVDTPSNVLTATGTTWTLGPCAAMLDPGASTYQGMYGWSSDANVTGSVTAADATNARKDIVYIQVNDSSAGDGSGEITADVKYLAGTPSATPSTPTLPARSFLVGIIDVPVAGGGPPTVTLTKAKYVAAGGILPVTLADRDALTKYDDLTIRRTDLPTRPVQVWSVSAGKWLTTGGPGTVYTPLWTGVTDFGSGGELTGTYWVDGDRVTVQATARFGAGSTGLGTGIVRCPFPSGYPIVAGNYSKHLGSGNFFPATGSIRALTVFEDGGAASVWVASDPIKTPGEAALSNASGSFFNIKFSYQTSAV